MRTKPSVWIIGGEDVRLRLPFLHKLRDRGFDVTAVGSEDGQVIADSGFIYHRYPLYRWINPIADARSSAALERLFRKHEPDVVHGFDTKPAILATTAALRAGVPRRIRTITGMGYVHSSRSLLALALRPIYRRLQIRASRSASLTVFQNADDRRQFLDSKMVLPGREALVPGSGIDLDELDSRMADAATLARLRNEIGLGDGPVVTMVARLIAYKGVREYLEAAKIVRAKRSDVQFLLVGPAASEGRSAVPVDEIRAASEDVSWLGARSDVASLLALSDVFALPTFYREGVPRVLLEAAALGLPLVTTDMPGCRDVVRDGWNGRLVKTQDAQSLAAGILATIETPAEELAEYGDRSRRHIEDVFTLDRVVDAYAKIYEEAGSP